VERFDQRQGFLISALVHLVILMSLAGRQPGTSSTAPARPETVPQAGPRVFLPPAAMLRQLAPPPPARAQAPRPPVPTPPPSERLKSKISIGAPSQERAKGPLVLRREDDLTAVPKGTPNAQPSPPPTAPPPAPSPGEPAASQQAGQETPLSPGLRLPPGAGDVPRGQEGTPGKPVAQAGPSIASSLRNLDRQLQAEGPRGLPTGTGQQMGPLFFDPEGADFTVWINHFKNEVYRNWIVPQPALMGFRGHVDLEFSVERNGTLTGLRILKSAGTPALDKAAQNALLGSRLLPLPADYGPPQVTMQVTFYYNEGPAGS
jgi:protein TonB